MLWLYPHTKPSIMKLWLLTLLLYSLSFKILMWLLYPHTTGCIHPHTPPSIKKLWSLTLLLYSSFRILTWLLYPHTTPSLFYPSTYIHIQHLQSWSCGHSHYSRHFWHAYQASFKRILCENLGIDTCIVMNLCLIHHAKHVCLLTKMVYE